MAALSGRSSRKVASHPPPSGRNPRLTAASTGSRETGLSHRTFSMTDSHFVGLEEGVEGGVLRLEDDTRFRGGCSASVPRGCVGAAIWAGACGLITRRQVGTLRRGPARIECGPIRPAGDARECILPPTTICMEEEHDSSSEDEYLWTAASRLRLPRCGGNTALTCKDYEPRSLKQPSFRSSRSRSAPPSSTPLSRTARRAKALLPLPGIMLAAPSVDLTFDNDDDWMPPNSSSPRLYRAASVGNSWGVTSIGRGFQWTNRAQEEESESDREKDDLTASDALGTTKERPGLLRATRPPWLTTSTSAVPRSAAPNGVSLISTSLTPPSPLPSSSPRTASYIAGPLTRSPVQSRPSSPRPLSSRPSSRPTSPLPLSPMAASASSLRSPLSSSPSSPRSTQFPRMRRRSSQQRVSLVAGRVSIAPVEPPSPYPTGPQKLVRTNSAASYLSVASSTGPPTPGEKPRSVADRSIAEFVIEREIGRGAYGLVKRAREMMDDGSLGVRLHRYSLCLTHVTDIPIAAAPRHQANHQVTHSGRLLEAAPQVWHNPHRDLCHVCHFDHSLRIAATSSLGSTQEQTRRSERLGRG